MFYAHKGDSTDNAFTTINGFPTRSFKAFNTKKERQEYQDKIWKESGGQLNVIFCTSKFLKSCYPSFHVNGNDVYSCYEEYCMIQEYASEEI